MTWRPATKEDVQTRIRESAECDGPEMWASYAHHLIDPDLIAIDRFGQSEHVYVVAKMPSRVVYFDDVEEEWATAVEVDGKLIDCSLHGELRWAVAAAKRGGLS